MAIPTNSEASSNGVICHPTTSGRSSFGRVARLSGNIRQPDYIPANAVAGHKAEPRPGAGEEWLARPEHDGMDVESILIPLGPTDLNERDTTHFRWLRQTAAKSRSSASQSGRSSSQ